MPDFRRVDNLGGAAVADVDPRKARKSTGESRRTPARVFMCLSRDGLDPDELESTGGIDFLPACQRSEYPVPSLNPDVLDMGHTTS